jgi:hypothetical protein
MTRQTTILRSLLGMLLLGLVLGCGWLHGLSLESADASPELAHLRLPVLLAVLAGLVPVVMAIKAVFDFLEAVDRGATCSARTVEILRRLRLLLGVFAGYLALGFGGFWGATGLMHPTLVLLWFVLEVAALFLFAMVALLEQILVDALELRQDDELTV